MDTPLDAARAFLEEDGMSFHEAGGSILLPVSDAGLGRWTARLWVASGIFLCSSAFPVFVPPDRRPAVAELLARLNWPLLLGNWELDGSDGDVRYRTSATCRHLDLTPAAARDLCYTNFGTVAEGWRPLLDVIASDVTPAEAVEAQQVRARGDRHTFDAFMNRTGIDPADGQA